MSMQRTNNKITISFTNKDEDIFEYMLKLKENNSASVFVREAIREKMEKKEKEVGLEGEIKEELVKINQKLDKLEGKKEVFEQRKESLGDNFVVKRENRFGSVVFRDKE